MQFRFFSISASGDGEAELNTFLRTHRAISVQRELVPRGAASPYWCICVEFLDGAPPAAGKEDNRRRVDYKQRLTEADFALFVELRELRKKLATEEAIPVYAICTNEHKPTRFMTYACRKGKDVDGALKRAMAFARRGGWFLKLSSRGSASSRPNDVDLRKSRVVTGGPPVPWMPVNVPNLALTPIGVKAISRWSPIGAPPESGPTRHPHPGGMPA